MNITIFAHLVAAPNNLVAIFLINPFFRRFYYSFKGTSFALYDAEVNKMKTILTILIFGSFSFAYANALQDSTQNQNREQEQKQIQEQNQLKNQGDENQIRDRNRLHTGDPISDKNGKKHGKDVFIDKDGDGIADTRAGGMSLEKIRKRTRAGQGSGGHGGSGNGSSGSGGNGGRK